MSQSKQALRARIKSVNSTRKITKAMEMIANAKLVKQRNRMEANREYAQKLQDTVDEIVANNRDAECKYMHHKGNGKTATIIFCSDLGLCGAYNQNVVKYAKEHIKLEDPILLIGTSMYRTMREAGFNLVNEYPIEGDKLKFLALKDLTQEMIQKYLKDEVGVVQVLYTKFVNTMTFKPELDILLPTERKEVKVKKEEGKMHVETLFEPDATTILNELIPMMIYDVIYADWMESSTAEQGSRRMAMKTATDNADELSTNLMLEYNKARQAAITQEITEIVGGSAAV